MNKRKILFIFLFVLFALVCASTRAEAEETPSLKINFINVDDDGLYVEDWIEVNRASTTNDTTYFGANLILFRLGENDAINGAELFKISYHKPQIDLLEEYPDFFEDGTKYAIVMQSQSYGSDFWIDPVVAGYDAYYNQNKIDQFTDASWTSMYAFCYAFNYDAQSDFKLDIYWQMMTGRYNFKIHSVMEESDPDLEPMKTHHYYLEYAGKYMKLISEDDGNRVYVSVPSSIVGTKVSRDELTEYVLDIDTDKLTTVIVPGKISGGQFRYTAYDDFIPGYLGYSYYSDGSGPGLKASRNFIFAFASKYGIKTFTKTDVEGNKTDAQFEIAINYSGQKRKFRYRHLDEKVINGTTYKNVYVVIGAADMDEETEDSIINTENGDFTLYYPLFREGMHTYANSNGNYLEDNNVYNINNLYLIEKGADEEYIINDEQELSTPNSSAGLSRDSSHDEEYGFRANVVNNVPNIVDRVAITDTLFKQTTEINEQAILGLFDEVQSDDNEHIIIVNKKKPVVEGVFIDDSSYDGEFEYNVYEKDSGRLVGTKRIKLNQKFILESSEDQDGFLEDGKTYIIRQAKSDDYDNIKIEGTNGTIDEDEISKYYEFTYAKDLNKVFSVTFYNKLLINENEDPEDSSSNEEKPESNAKQPKTGDYITAYIGALVLAFSMLTIIRKNNRKK